MRLTRSTRGDVQIRPEATGSRRPILATIPAPYASPSALREIAQLLLDAASQVETEAGRRG